MKKITLLSVILLLLTAIDIPRLLRRSQANQPLLLPEVEDWDDDIQQDQKDRTYSRYLNLPFIR